MCSPSKGRSEVGVTSVVFVVTVCSGVQVDVPHFHGKNWNYIKGAFMTIDRPYGKLFDFLHHRIGSTHVVHHIDCTIPHYRALEVARVRMALGLGLG